MKTDVNYLSIADTNGVHMENVKLPKEGESASNYDDVLKFSNAQDCSFADGYVEGGRENAVDINRNCRNILIRDTTLKGGDHCSVVIKGGSRAIDLLRVLIVPGGGHYDIELGGWSDQSKEKTGLVLLEHVMRTDGKPVRVAVGNAKRPMVYGGNVKVLFWWSLGLKLYVWAKGIFR